VPALGAITREILDHLTAAHAEGPHRPLRPIHGSFRANQCFIDGDRVGLLDLDRFGWGDPEMDAGAFLNDLACLDRLAHPVDVLQQCFLDEYQAVAGPLRRQLLTAYGAHARLAKALRAAQALRPDGDARARRLTEETLRFLSDGVRS
jgi:aminoglycoside phosphotransferase (APT) family kinase protein